MKKISPINNTFRRRAGRARARARFPKHTATTSFTRILSSDNTQYPPDNFFSDSRRIYISIIFNNRDYITTLFETYFEYATAAASFVHRVRVARAYRFRVSYGSADCATRLTISIFVHITCRTIFTRLYKIRKYSPANTAVLLCRGS